MKGKVLAVAGSAGTAAAAAIALLLMTRSGKPVPPAITVTLVASEPIRPPEVTVDRFLVLEMVGGPVTWTGTLMFWPSIVEATVEDYAGNLGHTSWARTPTPTATPVPTVTATEGPTGVQEWRSYE